MAIRLAPILLGAAVLGAAGFAAFRSEKSSAVMPAGGPQVAEVSSVTEPQPGMTLPPNHPPIGAGSAAHVVAATDDSLAITWKIPNGWQTVANPSTMRIATYHLGTGADDDPEMSVARAGGGIDANIERWLGQFDDAGQEKRTEKTVHGLKVTVVEVNGTYLGGGMMAAPSARHSGWALLGAIVEPSNGSPYFFKMLGGAPKIRAARGGFDALVGSVTPK